MEILPSGVRRGFTSSFRTASLKETVAGLVEEAGVTYGTSSPCLIMAFTLSIVVIFGDEIMRVSLLVSLAAICTSRIALELPRTMPSVGAVKVDAMGRKFTASASLVRPTPVGGVVTSEFSRDGLVPPATP